MNNDCPHEMACIRERCENPCVNSCGPNAECHVVAHSAFCNCLPGYQGDAFTGCTQNPVERVPLNPCSSTPCGENSICTVENGIAKCSCISPYIGNAYGAGCRPECVYNSDCASGMACIRQHCRDPCPGVCGSFAECSVVNHVPVCTCMRNYQGDPFTACRPTLPKERKFTTISRNFDFYLEYNILFDFDARSDNFDNTFGIIEKFGCFLCAFFTAPFLQNPCEPSPCGSNSICRVIGDQPSCSCQPGFAGYPPQCRSERPECVTSSECVQHEACINQKCRNPCEGTCGLGAECRVKNHNPICSCPIGYIGDPFNNCLPQRMKNNNSFSFSL